jgi:hypothetical protein
MQRLMSTKGACPGSADVMDKLLDELHPATGGLSDLDRLEACIDVHFLHGGIFTLQAPATPTNLVEVTSSSNGGKAQLGVTYASIADIRAHRVAVEAATLTLEGDLYNQAAVDSAAAAVWAANDSTPSPLPAERPGSARLARRPRPPRRPRAQCAAAAAAARRPGGAAPCATSHTCRRRRGAHGGAERAGTDGPPARRAPPPRSSPTPRS